MKRGAQISLLIFVIGLLLSLVQLWLTPLSSALFTKVMMSLGGLFLISGATTLVIHEYSEQQRRTESGHIDTRKLLDKRQFLLDFVRKFIAPPDDRAYGGHPFCQRPRRG